MRTKIQRINDLTNGPVFVRFCFGDGGGGDGDAGPGGAGYGDDSEEGRGDIGMGGYSDAVSDALGAMSTDDGGGDFDESAMEAEATAGSTVGSAGSGSAEGDDSTDSWMDTLSHTTFDDDDDDSPPTTNQTTTTDTSALDAMVFDDDKTEDDPLDSMTFDDDRLDERDVEDYSQEEQNLWGKQLTDEERSLLMDVTHAKGKQNFTNLFDLDEDVQKAMDSRTESPSIVGQLLGTTSLGTIAGMLAGINAKGLDTSPEAAETRGNTLSGMVNDADLAEALDAVDNVTEGAGGDAGDVPVTGGAQTVNAKTVGARKKSFPQNWFPPGVDYNAVFIDDDGTVKTNAEMEQALVDAWTAHGQAGGSGEGTNDVWGTDIDVGSLVGAGQVGASLQNFYESGKYGRFIKYIQALGGNSSLLSPSSYREFDAQYDEENPFLQPGWQTNMPHAQYVDVNPGLSEHWDQFVKGMGGQTMDANVQLHPNMSNAEVLDYWQDLIGKDSFTKEEFGQAHMEQEGGKHSLGRGRKLFNWRAPNDPVPVEEPPVVDPPGGGGGEVAENFGTDLPPASSFVTPPMAADAAGSGVSTTALEEVRNRNPYSPTEGVNYLIPVRDRYTGKIRYVPRHMAGSFNQPMYGATSTGPGVYSYPAAWGRRGQVASPAAAYPASSRRAGWGNIISV